jgi:hypothetical protein
MAGLPAIKYTTARPHIFNGKSKKEPGGNFITYMLFLKIKTI